MQILTKEGVYGQSYLKDEEKELKRVYRISYTCYWYWFGFTILLAQKTCETIYKYLNKESKHFMFILLR